MTVQNFNTTGQQFDHGTIVPQETLNSWLIHNYQSGGYKWAQGKQHQTIVKVGTIISDGFINAEVPNKANTGYVDSRNQDWKNNSGNTKYIELPAEFHMQIYDSQNFIKAPESVKAQQMMGLARLYTSIADKSIEAAATIASIRTTLTDAAKSKGYIVETYDRLPLFPQIYKAEDAQRQAQAQDLDAIYKTQAPMIQSVHLTNSFGSLFLPGAPLENYVVYEKVNGNRKTYKVRKK